MSETSSWFAGICTCGYKVVVTQPSVKSDMDYWWYCSNKECANHNPGEETGDMEHPIWVTLKEFAERAQQTTSTASTLCSCYKYGHIIKCGQCGGDLFYPIK